jgi:pyruvate kinase
LQGPEIRTALLKDHKNIQLTAGQDIVIEAVGDAYTQFEVRSHQAFVITATICVSALQSPVDSRLIA